MKRKVLIITVSLTILLLGYWVFTKYKKGKSNMPQYQTQTAERGTLIVSVTASGQISASGSAPVTTMASGVVTHVYVQNNQAVKSGTPLAVIDLDQVSIAKYMTANNAYSTAVNNLNSLQSKLFVANQKFINDAVARNLSITDPTYIEQNADWKAAENDYKNQTNVIGASWLALSQVSPTIYAPISGTVTGFFLQQGTVISGSQRVANIVTRAKPVITVNLSELDVSKVQIGNKATITLDAYPDKTFTGKIVSIDTVGIVASNVTAYPATIVFDLDSPEIYSNMAASASIITKTKDNVVLVPNSAIKNQNGDTSVQIMKNNRPEQATVVTGITSDSQTEIISGVLEGDVVVTGQINTPSTGSTGTTTSPFGNTRGGFGGAGTVIRGGGR